VKKKTSEWRKIGIRMLTSDDSTSDPTSVFSVVGDDVPAGPEEQRE
jgi:hypothetical protein